MDADSRTFEVKTDIAKNVIFIKYDGYIKGETLKDLVDTIIREVGKLSRGFTMVTDHSTSQAVPQSDLAEIERAQKAIKQSAIKRIIRVNSKDNPFSKMQFNRLSKHNYGDEVEIVFVDSLDEAKSYLR